MVDYYYMIQEFLMRKMLGRELDKAGVPKEQQEKLIGVISKNPELFKKIALEAKAKIDSGMDQTKAMQEVMTKYKSDLEGLV